MYNEKDFQDYMANPAWKEYYNNAPENAKEHIKYDFGSFSTWMGNDVEDEQKSHEHLHRIMERFTDEDWDYIIKNCGNNMGRASLKKKRAAMQGSKSDFSGDPV